MGVEPFSFKQTAREDAALGLLAHNWRGLLMGTKTMIAKVDGREVAVYESTGKIVRRFHCRTNVDTAYVNGDQVNIQLSDGHCEIYDLNGRIIRRV